MPNIYIYILILLSSYTLTFFIFRFLLKQASKYSIKKANISAIRFRSQAKPVSGGVGFFIVFLLSFVILTYFIFDKFLINAIDVAIGISLIIAFLSGLLDDIINTTPIVKFSSQILISIICIRAGIEIYHFENSLYNHTLTLVWIVGVMNSINMLDNMDGVTAVSIIGILLSITGILYFLNIDINNLFMGLIMLGSLLAFLYYNWPTSSMYMGDNGSQFLGALIAILSIRYLWNINAEFAQPAILKSFAVVFLAFLIPFTDTFTVSLNRIMKGKSPFIGDRNHTTHHFYYRGMSEKGIVSMFFFISIYFNIIALLLTINVISLSSPISIISFILAILYFFIAYFNTKIKHKTQSES